MEEKQITLQIDRHYITVPEGSTILEAARKIGIDIPTLCHIDLKGTCVKNNPASCRICVVEVEGRRNLNCAAYTNVDRAEDDFAMADLLNNKAVEIGRASCRERV